MSEYPKWVTLPDHSRWIVPDAATETQLMAGTHVPSPAVQSAQGQDPIVRGIVPVTPPEAVPEPVALADVAPPKKKRPL